MEEIKLQPPTNPQATTQPSVQPASLNSNPNPDPILKKMPTGESKSKIKKILPILLTLIIVGVGVFTGLTLSSMNKGQEIASQNLATEENLSGEQKQSFNQTFRDEAEGTIERNDSLDKYAQGTHKLVRTGGESQTAYLTSSVLDLDQYNGKKVKVFGETFGTSQVGWLMDVGKVEVIN